MENLTIYEKLKIRAAVKALDRSEQLLEKPLETLSYDDIQSVKSILYAAIEQIGTRIERLATVQRMLRELFIIITSNVELKEYEREVGTQIISEIKERYGAILGIEDCRSEDESNL